MIMNGSACTVSIKCIYAKHQTIFRLVIGKLYFKYEIVRLAKISFKIKQYERYFKTRYVLYHDILILEVKGKSLS